MNYLNDIEQDLNRLDALIYMCMMAFGHDNDDGIQSDMSNNLYEYAFVLNDVSAEIRDKLYKARSELKENP